MNNMVIVFMMAEILILATKNGVKNVSLCFLTCLVMISLDSFSNASAIAGSVSVIKLIYNSPIGVKKLIPDATPIKTTITSAIFPVSKYTSALRILSKIRLPSLIAVTILEKLSSVSIISETPFETSVPDILYAQGS